MYLYPCIRLDEAYNLNRRVKNSIFEASLTWIRKRTFIFKRCLINEANSNFFFFSLRQISFHLFPRIIYLENKCGKCGGWNRYEWVISVCFPSISIQIRYFFFRSRNGIKFVVKLHPIIRREILYHLTEDNTVCYF